MPIVLAAAATLVHLVLAVTLWFLRVPGASYVAIATLLVLAAAAFLLRNREPLFLLAGVLYVVETILALALVLVARDELMAVNALLGALLPPVEVLATVLFLVAFARLVREDRALRTGFLSVGCAAGFLGVGQVVMGVWLLVGPPPDLVLQTAVMLYSDGRLAWLSILVEAATLLLLGMTWRRHFTAPGLRRPLPA